jgi:hypothetical protein
MCVIGSRWTGTIASFCVFWITLDALLARIGHASIERKFYGLKFRPGDELGIEWWMVMKWHEIENKKIREDGCNRAALQWAQERASNLFSGNDGRTHKAGTWS